MENAIQTKLGHYATIKQVKCIDLTDLVPEEWDWFWDMLGSANPDFSYGDNNLTLIAGERFARFIDDAYEWFSNGFNEEDEEAPITCSEEEWKAFGDMLWDLNKEQIYINVEA
jgi:hypothetical protein